MSITRVERCDTVRTRCLQVEASDGIFLVGKTFIPTHNSDLRAMESQALGIPVVADRHYSASILDGETGKIVRGPTDAKVSLLEIVLDDALREKMSDRARAHAIEKFSMQTRVHQWETTLAEARRITV